ncbi:MAG: hypothetical protein Q7U76_17035 [Nitrospirota bacterium]|nr:hypothetical protein [Nitrospirota bacterium]
MRMSSQCLLGVVLLGSLAACSSARHIPQPVVERNGLAITDNDPAVSEDLRACRTEVREAAPVSIQPRWIPPLGATANGVVLGTVDIPHPVWPSRGAYRQAMERCLTARGYAVHGWQ